MVNRPALKELGRFNLDPTPVNASRLLSIPSIYNVLQFETPKGPYSASLLAVLQWICFRGDEVLKKLVKHEAPPSQPSAADLNGGWKMVRDNS